MRSIVSGEELNGLELLRVVWVKFEGGASEVEVADLGALHEFPQCPDGTVLQQYLGEWLSIVQEQGQDLPQRHLTTLLVKMLPSDVHADVKRMNLLKAPLYADSHLPAIRSAPVDRLPRRSTPHPKALCFTANRQEADGSCSHHWPRGQLQG